MGSRDIESARRLYEFAAQVVARSGHNAYLPHQRTDPELAADLSPEVVFGTDRRELQRSDAMIAFLDEPSLGVGAELAICANGHIPTLGLASAASQVSRFAVGCLLESGGRFERFESADDIAPTIERFITDLSATVSAQ